MGNLAKFEAMIRADELAKHLANVEKLRGDLNAEQ
jgi:hypothetical protein